jgi:hypothetical protein
MSILQLTAMLTAGTGGMEAGESTAVTTVVGSPRVTFPTPVWVGGISHRRKGKYNGAYTPLMCLFGSR